MGAGRITVPAQFLRDFDEFCQLSGIAQDPEDERDLRDFIRRHPEDGMKWVRRSLQVHRYCQQKWGREPTVDECRAVLGQDADPQWFRTMGILMLAGICARRENFPLD